MAVNKIVTVVRRSQTLYLSVCEYNFGGLSSAGLERYLDTVEVVGSIPTDPTSGESSSETESKI